MNRREMLLSTAAAAAFSQLPFRFASAAEGRNRKVLFFTKSSGFEHSVVKREGDNLSHAERVLTELGKQHQFDVTATKDGRVFDKDLTEYDIIFFYTTGDLTRRGTDKTPPMSDEGKQRLLDAIAGGKGFVGSHVPRTRFTPTACRARPRRKSIRTSP
jgi:hypothetical protein